MLQVVAQVLPLFQPGRRVGQLLQIVQHGGEQGVGHAVAGAAEECAVAELPGEQVQGLDGRRRGGGQRFGIDGTGRGDRRGDQQQVAADQPVVDVQGERGGPLVHFGALRQVVRLQRGLRKGRVEVAADAGGFEDLPFAVQQHGHFAEGMQGQVFGAVPGDGAAVHLQAMGVFQRLFLAVQPDAAGEGAEVWAEYVRFHGAFPDGGELAW